MTYLKKIAVAALVGAASIGLSGCATGLPAKVTRFQAMPAPQGETFFVVPGQGLAQGGGLEFSRYADLVSRHLAAQGYRQASSPQTASMIVQLGYNVDEGVERRVVDRFGHDPFLSGYNPYYGGYYSPYGRFGSRFDPYWGVYYGRPYYSRYGYWGHPRSAFYYGWDDPFWFGGPSIREYTEYKSELDLDIRRRADNAQLFDGRAVARSTTDETSVLVPNLIQAMFTGFPGRNGETIRITVPSSRKR
jgi:hypothetical protein